MFNEICSNKNFNIFAQFFSSTCTCMSLPSIEIVTKGKFSVLTRSENDFVFIFWQFYSFMLNIYFITDIQFYRYETLRFDCPNKFSLRFLLIRHVNNFSIDMSNFRLK